MGRKGNQNEERKAQDRQLHDDLVLLASGWQENERWSPSRQTATFNLVGKQNRPFWDNYKTQENSWDRENVIL
jgi:hypothetical protein